MVRALLDANVLISAAIRPSGPPGLLLHALLTHAAFELVLSEAIVDEVAQAMTRPKVRRYLRDPGEVHSWLADIVALADVVEDTGSVGGVSRDPDDDVVLAAAIEGRAEAIVTGDDDLLSLGEYEGIAIVSLRQFLATIKGPGRLQGPP